VVTGQLGSPGCPVQVQSPALHWARRFLVHVLAAMPVKAPHAELIWLAQVFLLHVGGDAAVAKEETKTPAPSATAANVTPALLVTVELLSSFSRQWTASADGVHECSMQSAPSRLANGTREGEAQRWDIVTLTVWLVDSPWVHFQASLSLPSSLSFFTTRRDRLARVGTSSSPWLPLCAARWEAVCTRQTAPRNVNLLPETACRRLRPGIVRAEAPDMAFGVAGGVLA
jgi:hypothetical protein